MVQLLIIANWPWVSLWRNSSGWHCIPQWQSGLPEGAWTWEPARSRGPCVLAACMLCLKGWQFAINVFPWIEITQCYSLMLYLFSEWGRCLWRCRAPGWNPPGCWRTHGRQTHCPWWGQTPHSWFVCSARRLWTTPVHDSDIGTWHINYPIITPAFRSNVTLYVLVFKLFCVHWQLYQTYTQSLERGV